MIMEEKRSPYIKNQWYGKLMYHHVPIHGNTREDILDYLLRTDIVNYYVTYCLQLPIDNEECQEYIQEIWLQICELKEEKLQDLLEQGKTALTAFIAVLIKQNCKSRTSPAYCKVRKPKKGHIHIQEREWNMYDEEGKWPDYLTIVQTQFEYDQMIKNNE